MKNLKKGNLKNIKNQYLHKENQFKFNKKIKNQLEDNNKFQINFKNIKININKLWLELKNKTHI